MSTSFTRRTERRRESERARSIIYSNDYEANSNRWKVPKWVIQISTPMATTGQRPTANGSPLAVDSAAPPAAANPRITFWSPRLRRFPFRVFAFPPQSTRHAADGVPNLILEKKRYSIGDTLRANCTSPPSTPAANITWYINDKQVNASFHNRHQWTANGNEAHKMRSKSARLYATSAGLQRVVDGFEFRQLRIACVADLFQTFLTRAEIVLHQRNPKLELGSIVYTMSDSTYTSTSTSFNTLAAAAAAAAASSFRSVPFRSVPFRSIPRSAVASPSTSTSPSPSSYHLPDVFLYSTLLLVTEVTFFSVFSKFRVGFLRE
ncbi:hypothetical protein V9T40_007473 [Parthenolecanium corni]|uniref:CD80-like immunoglobulin C2-set domain-containing protein n=1 Tax=Parthenolecanium corni TaxID=536013 RepID=A0AAN9Y650_9HEMI